MTPTFLQRLTLALGLTLSAAAFAAAPAAPAAPPATPAPKGVRTIYLIRHGIYDRDDKVDDRVGNGLNALGREQAALIGARLAALPVHLNTLVSSTLLRARETADLMAPAMHMSVVRDSLLSECTPTTTRLDYMKDQTPEEIAGCDAQLNAAWAMYVRPSPEADTHDVLVCHGNVIRWFVARALGMDTKQWANFDIGNCSLTVIYVRPDGTTRLAVFSDVGHLPVEKQTWAGRGGGWGVGR